VIVGVMAGLLAPLAGRAQTPHCMAVGAKLKCGVALAPAVQGPIAPAGQAVPAVPALRRLNTGGLSDSLKIIGGGLQRNTEQRRQTVVSLIMAGRCGEAQTYALQTGDAALASRVQGVCTQKSP